MAQRELNLKEKLQDRFVAFIDVMGFSNLVNRDSVADLESYFITVTDVLNKIRIDKGQIESLLISDAIILISPSGLKGLKDLLIAVRRIQSALLWRKILLRGAISYGQVFYDRRDNIIVGKGFIKAYLLEQEAVYPRVIVDPAIVKIIADDKEGFLRAIHKGIANEYDDNLVYKHQDGTLLRDDCIFVDYANKTVLLSSINGNIKKVHETIAKNMYSDQRLYSKYVWLRDYFLERLRLINSAIEGQWQDAILHEKKEPVSLSKQAKRINEWIQRFERL